MTSEAELIQTSHHAEPDSIRAVHVERAGAVVELVDDPYSDRLRCDHPTVHDPGHFATLLKDTARDLGRERVVVLADAEISEELQEHGFFREGEMPGFYRGESDCVVMGWAIDDDRLRLASPAAAVLTDEILEEKSDEPCLHVATSTDLATREDADELAGLLAATFAEYPTPSSDPAYLMQEMDRGTPFRVVREDGEIAACASADLIVDAETAELTDCATRPDSRGRGYMQSILRDLMNDLRKRDYPTAFTLARACVPGVNIAFQRLGFEYRGRMPKSCRIGDGLEDMNIWSRWL